jgi:hypothetical protein
MSNFAYFNPDNFKKWMRSQDGFDTELKQNLIGMDVETKLRKISIVKHAILESGSIQKIAKEFTENGGIIKEVDGEEYLIEVKSGSFYINKKYVIV